MGVKEKQGDNKEDIDRKCLEKIIREENEKIRRLYESRKPPPNEEVAGNDQDGRDNQEAIRREQPRQIGR